MRRRAGIVVLVALISALSPLARADVISPPGCNQGASGDFNGDGRDDLAVGVPSEDVGTHTNNGAVDVVYGSATGLNGVGAPSPQFVTQASIGGSSEGGDQFGACVAAGDFNGDARDDLAIGVPHEDFSGLNNAGLIDVVYGSATGLDLTTARGFSQATNNIAGDAEDGDQFGAALATGNFNGDVNGANPIDDLAIGVPFEDIGTKADAGAVNVIYGGTTNGLKTDGNKVFYQDAKGVEGKSEQGDKFGSALASGNFNGNVNVTTPVDDLAIGVPGEDASHNNTGAVNVLYGTSGGLKSGGDQLWRQNSTDIAGTEEGGDAFGSALTSGNFNGDTSAGTPIDDLAIGVPLEDVNGISNAGAVNVIYGSTSKLSATAVVANQLWFQGAPPGDVNFQSGDTPETDDLFGGVLASGDANSDGRDDLAIGVSLEDNGVTDEGAVNFVLGDPAGLKETTGVLFDQDSIGGTGVAGDVFASALTTGNFDAVAGADLAIGTPGKEVGGDQDAGMVYADPAPWGTGVAQQLTQDSLAAGGDTSEPDDNFGSVLG